MIAVIISEVDYQPINCSFYDLLEEAATLQKRVLIKYFSDDKLMEEIDSIKNLYIESKQEFMILGAGKIIRLDKIISIDGVELKNFHP